MSGRPTDRYWREIARVEGRPLATTKPAPRFTHEDRRNHLAELARPIEPRHQWSPAQLAVLQAVGEMIGGTRRVQTMYFPLVLD